MVCSEILPILELSNKKKLNKNKLNQLLSMNLIKDGETYMRIYQKFTAIFYHILMNTQVLSSF